MTQKRIGIIVVAYNAATTLASVLDRIPNEFRSRITEVFVCDDASQDSTYLVGLGYRQTRDDLPLTVIRNPRNLGYGGNQKAAYLRAIEGGLDIAVLLHGDGQYAPELLPEMVAPLEREECDAVFGSRMMVRGAARRGGMPLYKLVGNRILTGIENRTLGTDLSEFHSGYRAYDLHALAALPFEQLSDGFNFDTQIIIALHDAGSRIKEIPIPTYYGDEICYVNGLSYARDVVRDVSRYRLAKMGFGASELARARHGNGEYELKDGQSSHRLILSRLEHLPPSRVLDVGCSSGLLAERMGQLGHEVTGTDVHAFDAAPPRMHRFVRCDLENGLSDELGDGFDVVVLADVLEHVRDPERLLREATARLRPGGTLITSVPNFGHWYPRLRTAAGRFDYDQRGILDVGHLRFFTIASFERLAARSGLRVKRREPAGSPVSLALPKGRLQTLLEKADRVAADLYPRLFAYQVVFELEPSAADDHHPRSMELAGHQ